jgi:hypothetical protein
VSLKLGKWLIFEVLIALVPLAFNWFGAVLRDGDSTASAVLGRGELLLVSTAIVAASLGELMNKGLNEHLRGTKQMLVGVGIILIIAATWLYSEAAVTPGEVPLADVGPVVTMSCVIAAVASILSASCLVVAEVK